MKADGVRKAEPRLVLLRIFSITALAAAGILMGDALHPDRGFCPLEASCAEAAGSALGRLFGVPTSAFGAAAFGAFLLLTFLPWAWVPRVLRPAGIAAGVLGAVFIGYQLLALRGVCEFCLVADVSGIGAGAVVATWKPARGRWKGPPEHMAVRLRWALVGVLALLVPLLWPRPAQRPSWIPLPGVAEAADAGRGFGVLTAQPVDPRGAGAAGARGGAGRSGAAASSRELTIVEYLNPYCGHCRATHARLERVLASYPTPTRIDRVYVWGTPEPPLWARVCVCAAPQGKEAETFAQLIRAPDATPESIWAAVARTGVDVEKVRAAVERGEGAERFAEARRRLQASRIEGLPTFDIGQRRLQGDQSEAEIRDALDAAAALLPPAVH